MTIEEDLLELSGYSVSAVKDLISKRILKVEEKTNSVVTINTKFIRGKVMTIYCEERDKDKLTVDYSNKLMNTANKYGADIISVDFGAFGDKTVEMYGKNKNGKLVILHTKIKE